MSVQHMSWAFKQELESGPKFVLVAIANFADGSGLCFPGQERLARMTGFSVRSIRNHVLALEEAGLIQRSGRRRDDGMKTSDEYQLLMSPANTAGEVDLTSPAESAAKLPAKPAGKKRKSPAESAATHRQNFPTSPAEPAGRNRARTENETPSPTQHNAESPAESAGSTIRLTISNNHQDTKPPTPLKQKPKEQPEKPSGFDPAAVDLPANVNRQIWTSFVDHRKEIGKTLRPTGTKNLLEKLRSFGSQANAALTATVENGWTGVFEPKDDRKPGKSGKQTDPAADDLLAQYRERGL